MTPPEADDAVRPSIGAADAAAEVYELWQGGQHESALARLDPYRERSESWALCINAMLQMEQGPDGLRRAYESVRLCVELGMPWVATSFANKVLPVADTVPELVQPTLDLIKASGFQAGPGAFDLLAQGWNLLARDQPKAAVDLLSLQWPRVADPATWGTLLTAAQDRVDALSGIVDRARTNDQAVEDAAIIAQRSIDELRAEVSTKAGQVSLLIDSLSDRTVNALYTRDADNSAREGRITWLFGLGVLTAAILVALWPLATYYAGHGPTYQPGALLAVHVGPTLTLGALAGVLLGRARIRDRARQRSTDLATAMGTMIIYSDKIEDVGARQEFMQNMGRLILEAHLRSDGSITAATNDGGVGVLALASALRDQRL